MAWVKLTNSTTADADDVHGNFKEIRSGTLLPMLISTTVSTTDGAYDIGSATKKWKSLYVYSISCIDIPRLIVSTSTSVIGYTIPSSVSYNLSNAKKYIINGLVRMDVGTSIIRQIKIGFNNVSTASYVNYLTYSGGSISGTQTAFQTLYYTSSNGFFICGFNIEITNLQTSSSWMNIIQSRCSGFSNVVSSEQVDQFAHGSFLNGISSIQINFNNTTTAMDIKIYAVET